jgi:hypothetical protein
MIGVHYKFGSTLLEKDILRVVGFWLPKANAWRDGRQWLVLSREEMQARLHCDTNTGKKPSLRSVSRAVAALRDEGILIISYHRHPFRSMRGPVWWISLDTAKIEKEMSRRRQQTKQLTGNKLATTIKQVNSEQGTDGQISGKPQSQPIDMQEADVFSGELLIKKKPKVTSGDALAVFSDNKLTSDYPIVNKPEIAHKCLRDACIAAGYPSPGSFNKKRGGQMRTMLKRMAEEDVEPEKVAAMLFFVAKKWPEFIGYCKTKFNVVVPGTVPNHNALTLHTVEAVGFWRTYQAGGPVKEKSGEYGSSLDEGL